ncbi:hypothetical protein [Demequina sp. NBRC 110051]|uniref:hypothetical protein n=1 Tax=Demequina sp. NBRC 110051 TaxID=1570340 RepID=UPI00118005D6|nr:hypothetical protein [Demequina sp. NBRC 110051]
MNHLRLVPDNSPADVHVNVSRSRYQDTLDTSDEDKGRRANDGIGYRALLQERLLRMADLVAQMHGDGRRTCGTQPRHKLGGVRLAFRDGQAYYQGLHVCDSKTVCPRCVRPLYRERYRDIRQTLDDVHAIGGTAVLVSLSLSFPENTGLTERLDILAPVYSTLNSRRQRLRKKLGMQGQIKAIHPLHGSHGWHAHLHVLYLFDTKLDEAQVQELDAWESKTWARLAQAHGCVARPSLQTYTVVGPTEQDRENVARYITKALGEIENGGPDDEDQDEGKGKGDGAGRSKESGQTVDFECDLDAGSQSPWQLLDDAAIGSDDYARELVMEWFTTMRANRRRHWYFPWEAMAELHRRADARRAAHRSRLVGCAA